MILRRFSIIYLIVNILFAIPAVIDKMGIIHLYNIHVAVTFMYYLPALIYYLLGLTYANVAFFAMLTAVNIWVSIKTKKVNTLFFCIYAVLLIIAMSLNLLWAINGMQILIV